MVWKALSHLASHSPSEGLFRTLKNGQRRFKYLEMNLLNDDNFSVKPVFASLFWEAESVERLRPARVPFRFHTYLQ